MDETKSPKTSLLPDVSLSATTLVASRWRYSPAQTAWQSGTVLPVLYFMFVNENTHPK